MDAPGKPTVVDSANNFIKVQWEKPQRDGGAPLTGYSIERNDPHTGTWNRLNDEPIKVMLLTQTFVIVVVVIFVIWPHRSPAVHRCSCLQCGLCVFLSTGRLGLSVSWVCCCAKMAELIEMLFMPNSHHRCQRNKTVVSSV